MSDNRELLTSIPRLITPPLGHSLAVARERFGVSTGRQLREMIALRYGPGKLVPYEYFRFGLYDPNISRAEKRNYLGDVTGNALNLSMTAPIHRPALFALQNKAILLALCQASNIAVTPTQAICGAVLSIGPWRSLRMAAQIADFLKHDAHYPLFGKPIDGRQGVGAIKILGINGDGTLDVTEEKTGFTPDDLAAEIVAKFPTGYLLQDSVANTPELECFSTERLSPVRLVTLLDGSGHPQPLYAIFRSPSSPTARFGDPAVKVMRIALDMATARGTHATIGAGLSAQRLQTLPTADTPIADIEFSQLPAAIELAQRAHRMLPEIGLIGWDIGLTPHGPMIMEGNANPGVNLYQFTHLHGILCPEFAPKFATARALADTRQKEAAQIKSDWQHGAFREIVALERQNHR